MGIKVTVSQVVPTPSGLRMGLRVEHTQAKWVRFCTTVILYTDLTYAERQTICAYLAGDFGPDEVLDAPLF